jgi:hypothetical protein
MPSPVLEEPLLEAPSSIQCFAASLFTVRVVFPESDPSLTVFYSCFALRLFVDTCAFSVATAFFETLGILPTFFLRFQVFNFFFNVFFVFLAHTIRCILDYLLDSPAPLFPY